MEEILKQGLGSLGLDTAAVPQLTEFARRLLEKNKVMNLTAITEPKDVATLHLLDSAWWMWAPGPDFPECLWAFWSLRRS